MTYYKLLNADRTAPLKNWQWPRVGMWTPKIERIALCESGYHALRGFPHGDILEWSGEQLYEVELRGEIIEGDTKVVAQQARLVRQVKTWNDTNLRLFACDCAMRSVKRYEEKYPNDERVRDAIRIARRFALGKATQDELSAARSAARSAESAARSAAWSAESAAWSAAWSAARSAESAAWSAAWSAESAAWSAESAAWSAAWSAESAAWSAAWSAEKQWQLKRLYKYINGGLLKCRD